MKLTKKHIATSNITGRILVFAFILISLLLPVSARAVEPEYSLLAPLPCVPSGETVGVNEKGESIKIPAVNCAGNDYKVVDKMNFQQYISYAMNLLIALASVAAVFMIVWGGFKYMTSTIVSGKSDGLKKVQDAIWGLLLILSSYLILKTIDPRLVQIPNTLVPKINIMCPTTGQEQYSYSDSRCDASHDFFDRLSLEADEHRAKDLAAMKRIEETKLKTVAIEQRIQILENEIFLIENSDSGVPQEELSKKKLELQKNKDEKSDYDGLLLTDRAISQQERALTSLTAVADKGTLSAWQQFNGGLVSSDVRNARVDALNTIKNQEDLILKTHLSNLENLNKSTGPKTPEYTSRLNTQTDETLLKLTDIYIETYKKYSTFAVNDRHGAFDALLEFKKSTKLSDPVKQEANNKRLYDFCTTKAISTGNEYTICN